MHYVTLEDYGLVHHQKIKLTKEVEPCIFTAAISPQEQSKKKITKQFTLIPNSTIFPLNL